MAEIDLNELQRQLHDLKNKVETNEQLYQLRYAADHAAVATALISADKRLDLLNESRATVSDLTRNLANRMMPREELETRFSSITNERQTSRETMWARIEGRINPIADKLEQSQRPNVGLIVSAAVLGISLFSGLWFVLGLQINDRSNPMALQIEALKTTSIARDANLAVITATRNNEILSINTSIEKLSGEIRLVQAALASAQATQANQNDRISSLETELSVDRATRARAEATTEQKLVEVETQFGTIETVVNLMKDDTHQMIGVLWSKLFPGIQLPTKNYRPKVHSDQSSKDQ